MNVDSKFIFNVIFTVGNTQTLGKIILKSVQNMYLIIILHNFSQNILVLQIH